MSHSTQHGLGPNSKDTLCLTLINMVPRSLNVIVLSVVEFGTLGANITDRTQRN